MRAAILLAACVGLASPSLAAALPPGAAQGDDAEVTVVQTGATLRVRARPEAVWAQLTSCPALREFVPWLTACEVLETAPDGSWQRVRQVVDYSWFVPKFSYVFRASYDYPSRISIERESGDLRTLKCTWYLQPDGEFTIVRYSFEVVPGFWVPRWMVRLALKHDLPKMMRALRGRAEASAGPRPQG